MARILIVEDSPIELDKLVSTVESHGHQTLRAENGAEGVALARRELPDIVLMDVAMPVFNGFQATRQLRKDPKTAHIPVIIVSAKDQQTEKDWARRQGASEYLVKPVSERTLMSTIDSALAAETV